MPRTLGILFTWTTYGTWLRGDARGWVDEGIVFPPDPPLEAADRARLRYPPFQFPCDEHHAAGAFVGAAVEDLGGRVYALHVGSWHIHLVTGYVHVPVAQVTKAVEDRVRNGLRYRRAIWTGGYDKRFCFDRESVAHRVAYVRKHNLRDGLPADPWPFVRPPAWIHDPNA